MTFGADRLPATGQPAPAPRRCFDEVETMADTFTVCAENAT
jgi:hypothetical protein